MSRLLFNLIFNKILVADLVADATFDHNMQTSRYDTLLKVSNM